MTQEFSANTMQVGGNHYATGGDFQHWDLVENFGLGYLEGCATKYLIRWRKKNGLEDLKKARHYVVKLLELHLSGKRSPRGHVPYVELIKFGTRNDVTTREQAILELLCSTWSQFDLERAIRHIDALIQEATEQLSASADQSPTS